MLTKGAEAERDALELLPRLSEYGRRCCNWMLDVPTSVHTGLMLVEELTGFVVSLQKVTFIWHLSRVSWKTCICFLTRFSHKVSIHLNKRHGDLNLLNGFRENWRQINHLLKKFT